MSYLESIFSLAGKTAVVIGGTATSTALTLFVLPTLYAWIGGRRQA